MSEPVRQGLYDPRHEHDACGVGFVADVRGRRSPAIVRDALEVLVNLEHRGACGCEADTGDGAGMLLQVPDAFLRRECDAAGIALPEPGRYGVGMVFLPVDETRQQACRALVEDAIRAEGQTLLGWRAVPTDASRIGRAARDAAPSVHQVFVGRGPAVRDADAFERKLWVVRRRAEKAVAGLPALARSRFYVTSLSSRTLVYKGMLTARQLTQFYPDLLDGAVASALALVHSRFSTNTFPNWARAHPYRFLCHNGEINTLRGNVNWMRAREAVLRSELMGDDLATVLPAIDPDGSDSAMFDNVLELLALTGRSLPHAVMMMIPEPWTGDAAMPADKRAFYEFNACLMEPWDGPASIAFSDGVRIGAVLDRNGLRPSRYWLLDDDRVVMSSEVGVLDVPPERVRHKGRLQPGRMLLVDTSLGRVVDDGELKAAVAAERPYALWLDKLVRLEELPAAAPVAPARREDMRRAQEAFGYTAEELRIVVAPMAAEGLEALGSMGTDTPLAVLSERPQPLYNYFKQLFAQVTNPPVDAIREELVMAVETTLGAEGNLLEPGPGSARRIRLATPLLGSAELSALAGLDGSARARGFRAARLPMLFEAARLGEGLDAALDLLCREAAEAVRAGHDVVILTDRAFDALRAPIPALLAVSSVHHHLIREGLRTLCGLVVESGEPREVHHFALLIGYGANAVHPWLALDGVRELARQGVLGSVGADKAEKNYLKAAVKGVVKVMSKMGISTIQSYHGAQVFEAIGLDPELVERRFAGTPSRVGGVGLDVLAREAALRHSRAFPSRRPAGAFADGGGQYQFRRAGEHHLFNPLTVHKLQLACRTGDFKAFQEYSALVNDQSTRLATLRGLMELRPAGPPVPLEEVEPVEAIVKRFKTGAMSYGSISQEAHEALAIAMNRIGGKSNTGEGGEDPARFRSAPGAESRNSAIKQVASGRFGVTSEYLVSARELQIKMAQGAKPGEGGQLPGHKVYPWIARVRHSTPGVGLISPPPHHDIYSIEDLAELIHDLKNANPEARISVKLVAEVGVGTVAAGVAKAHADVILISGHDGGTGASPLTSIKHAGAPWELGLAETQQVLVLNDLRSRVTIETDGQLKTGRDVVVAALLGAEEFGFATAPLVALGCVMMRVCHLNTCPVGVATQDPELRKRFSGDPDHVVNFMKFIAREVQELMARLGFRTLDEMVGRSELLEMRPAVEHWKARGLDFSQILYQPVVGPEVGRRRLIAQDHGLDRALDRTALLDLCRPALDDGQPVAATLLIRNSHRVVGTMLGSRLTSLYGAAGLPDDTIQLQFQGSAGQSFGAFLPRGITLVLEGDANDYIGKGLSGGKIVVFPPRAATFRPEENVIVGNVAFYGATSGEAYVRGVAGERFCVRNSGLLAVVEAVGDHACEYMTGGRVVVLGATGRNFAAGMSGGIAYVLDEMAAFASRCNTAMADLTALEEPDEIELVKTLVFRHAQHTQSDRARAVLLDWESWRARFVRVLPRDFARVLEARREVERAGLSGEAAEMAAFQLNAKDAARAGGS